MFASEVHGGHDEGRKEVCHARDSQNWLMRVKSSALVTGFVLAEGTHQTDDPFGCIGTLKAPSTLPYRSYQLEHPAV